MYQYNSVYNEAAIDICHIRKKYMNKIKIRTSKYQKQKKY